MIDIFIEELNNDTLCLSKYENNFDELITDLFSYYEDIEKIEKIEKIEQVIYNLYNNIEKSEDYLLLEKFYLKIIHYMVKNYQNFDNLVSCCFYSNDSSFTVSVTQYIKIFCCLMDVKYEMVKIIVKTCIETENYQLITNMFQCNHSNLMREMFIVFRENLEYLDVFPKLPLFADRY